MAFLTIDGKEYEAKCNFAFENLASKKYDKEDKNGNKSGGFSALYTRLLQGTSNHDLVAFWDCALEYLNKKDKPSIEQIEAALEARIDEDGDTDGLFKEAFEAIDEGGFFKRQAKKFWKNLEIMKDYGKDEEEKEQNRKVYQTMIDNRDELRGLTTTD